MAKKLSELWSEGALRRQKQPGGGVVLIGAPDDRGVYNVGGRVGAASGPAAVRAALGRMMLGPAGELATYALDAGTDIAPTDPLEDTHQRLRMATEDALTKGLTPIVVGGGHDYGYPHIGGVADAVGAARTGLINIDAHLDVRPLDGAMVTSGSPYFLALEEGCLKGSHFVELGIQAHCNRADHFSYLKAKKSKVLMLEDARAGTGGLVGAFRRELKRLSAKKLRMAVSVDLDAVASCFAPGVSAPQADGLTPADLFAMMELCGANLSVVSLGFFELSPPLDHGEATARLCATAIHRFTTARAKIASKKVSRPSSKSR